MKMLKFAGLALVGFMVLGMGEGGGRHYGSAPRGPKYAPLEEGAGNYSGMIHDEQTATKVYGLSFYGHTYVAGVRRINNDSSDKIDFSEVKQITIINPDFVSKRFCERLFVRANALMNSGVEVKDLLFPKNVVVCAIEEQTKMKRSWYLGKINKLSNIQVAQSPKPVYSSEYYAKESRAKRAESWKGPGKPKETKPLETKKKEPASIFGAFIGIIDSIIMFVKSILRSITSLIGF